MEEQVKDNEGPDYKQIPMNSLTNRKNTLEELLNHTDPVQPPDPASQEHRASSRTHHQENKCGKILPTEE